MRAPELIHGEAAAMPEAFATAYLTVLEADCRRHTFLMHAGASGLASRGHPHGQAWRAGNPPRAVG